MTEPLSERYELRGGSTTFQGTTFLEEIDISDIDELRTYVVERYPGQFIWVVNKKINAPPFVFVPIKLRPITQHRSDDGAPTQPSDGLLPNAHQKDFKS
jgi:hypothetical protein